MPAEIIDFEEEVRKRQAEEIKALRSEIEYITQDMDTDINTMSLDYIMNIPVYSPGSYGDMNIHNSFCYVPPPCPNCGPHYWDALRFPENED